MKKTLLFFLVLLLTFGVGWVVSSWYLGQETERLLRQHLDPEQHLYVSDMLELTLLDYRKSLFSTRARTLLHFRQPPLNNLLGSLPLIHEIRHGPLLFNDRPRLAVSGWHTRLDGAQLDESQRAQWQAVFPSGQFPVVDAELDFRQQLHYALKFGPIAHQSEAGLQTVLAQGALSGSLDTQAGTGTLQGTLSVLELNGNTWTLKAPVVALQGTIAPLDGYPQLQNLGLHGNGLSLDRADGDIITLDGDLQWQMQQVAGELEGRLSLLLENINGSRNGLTQLDWRAAWQGVDAGGLGRLLGLQDRLDNLQARLDWNEENTELRDGQQHMQELLQAREAARLEYRQILFRQVLKPEQTRLEWTLATRQGNDIALESAASLQWTETGAGSLNPVRADDWLRPLRGALSLRSPADSLPVSLQSFLMYARSHQGLLMQDGEYRLVLKLQGDRAELNGRTLAVQALPGHFFPQSAMSTDTGDPLIPSGVLSRVEAGELGEGMLQQLRQDHQVTPEVLQLLQRLYEMNTALRQGIQGRRGQRGKAGRRR